MWWKQGCWEACHHGRSQDEQPGLEFISDGDFRDRNAEYWELAAAGLRTDGGGSERCRSETKAAPEADSFCSLPQSARTNCTMWKCGRMVSVHLLHSRDPAQPDSWGAAGQWGGSPAEAADISVSAVSEPRPTPASVTQLSTDPRGVSFPKEGPLAGPRASLEQIKASGKTIIISRDVWWPGLPSRLALLLQTALGTVCSCHCHVGSSPPPSKIPH